MAKQQQLKSAFNLSSDNIQPLSQFLNLPKDDGVRIFMDLNQRISDFTRPSSLLGRTRFDNFFSGANTGGLEGLFLNNFGQQFLPLILGGNHAFFNAGLLTRLNSLFSGPK